MTKKELQAIAEAHGFEIMRNPITGEGWGLRLETAQDIPELDALAASSDLYASVTVTKEYGAYYAANGTHLYTVYCPASWFVLGGWA